MALLDRTSTDDTWSELERAATARFWDGLALAASEGGRGLGAVYLMGYVVEFLLKTAYYRVRQVGATQPLAIEFAAIKTRARALNIAWHGNLHNLQSLSVLLVEERRSRGNPISPQLLAQLQGHVLVIAENWSEAIRYKDTLPTSMEISAVYASVEWVMANYSTLWS